MVEQKQRLWKKEFVCITVINLLLFCGFQMLMPTLPMYVKSLGGSDSIIGWIAGVSTLASLFIRPVSGIIVDRLGRKVVSMAGLVTIFAVTMGYGLVSAVGAILFVRFLHGFGWGAATTAGSTMAADVIPRSRFGEGMGFYSLSTSLAMAIAPGIGMVVLASYGFTTLFYCSAGFAVAALLLLIFLMPEKKQEQQTRGTIKGGPYERAAIGPACVIFFVCASYGSITGFLSIYAMEQGITNIGIFFTVYAIFLLISRPIFGKLTDRYGFNIAIYPGLLSLLVALIILSGATTLTSFLLSGVCYGIGFGSVQSSLQAMAMTKAPKGRTGAASATFFTGFDAGLGLGSVIAGLLAGAFGYSRMYLYVSLFIAIAAVVYFMGSRQKEAEKVVVKESV